MKKDDSDSETVTFFAVDESDTNSKSKPVVLAKVSPHIGGPQGSVHTSDKSSSPSSASSVAAAPKQVTVLFNQPQEFQTAAAVHKMPTTAISTTTGDSSIVPLPFMSIVESKREEKNVTTSVKVSPHIGRPYDRGSVHSSPSGSPSPSSDSSTAEAPKKITVLFNQPEEVQKAAAVGKSPTPKAATTTGESSTVPLPFMPIISEKKEEQKAKTHETLSNPDHPSGSSGKGKQPPPREADDKRTISDLLADRESNGETEGPRKRLKQEPSGQQSPRKGEEERQFTHLYGYQGLHENEPLLNTYNKPHTGMYGAMAWDPRLQGPPTLDPRINNPGDTRMQHPHQRYPMLQPPFPCDQRDQMFFSKDPRMQMSYPIDPRLHGQFPADQRVQSHYHINPRIQAPYSFDPHRQVPNVTDPSAQKHHNIQPELQTPPYNDPRVPGPHPSSTTFRMQGPLQDDSIYGNPRKRDHRDHPTMPDSQYADQQSQMHLPPGPKMQGLSEWELPIPSHVDSKLQSPDSIDPGMQDSHVRYQIIHDTYPNRQGIGGPRLEDPRLQGVYPHNPQKQSYSVHRPEQSQQHVSPRKQVFHPGEQRMSIVHGGPQTQTHISTEQRMYTLHPGDFRSQHPDSVHPRVPNTQLGEQRQYILGHPMMHRPQHGDLRWQGPHTEAPPMPELRPVDRTDPYHDGARVHGFNPGKLSQPEPSRNQPLRPCECDEQRTRPSHRSSLEQQTCAATHQRVDNDLTLHISSPDDHANTNSNVPRMRCVQNNSKLRSDTDALKLEKRQAFRTDSLSIQIQTVSKKDPHYLQVQNVHKYGYHRPRHFIFQRISVPQLPPPGVLLFQTLQQPALGMIQPPCPFIHHHPPNSSLDSGIKSTEDLQTGTYLASGVSIVTRSTDIAVLNFACQICNHNTDVHKTHGIHLKSGEIAEKKITCEKMKESGRVYNENQVIPNNSDLLEAQFQCSLHKKIPDVIISSVNAKQNNCDKKLAASVCSQKGTQQHSIAVYKTPCAAEDDTNSDQSAEQQDIEFVRHLPDVADNNVQQILHSTSIVQCATEMAVFDVFEDCYCFLSHGRSIEDHNVEMENLTRTFSDVLLTAPSVVQEEQSFADQVEDEDGDATTTDNELLNGEWKLQKD